MSVCAHPGLGAINTSPPVQVQRPLNAAPESSGGKRHMVGGVGGSSIGRPKDGLALPMQVNLSSLRCGPAIRQSGDGCFWAESGLRLS